METYKEMVKREAKEQARRRAREKMFEKARNDKQQTTIVKT